MHSDNSSQNVVSTVETLFCTAGSKNNIGSLCNEINCFLTNWSIYLTTILTFIVHQKKTKIKKIKHTIMASALSLMGLKRWAHI